MEPHRGWFDNYGSTHDDAIMSSAVNIYLAPMPMDKNR